MMSSMLYTTLHWNMEDCVSVLLHAHNVDRKRQRQRSRSALEPSAVISGGISVHTSSMREGTDCQADPDLHFDFSRQHRPDLHTSDE